jgi:DNA-binding transcriptional MerR regulator
MPEELSLAELAEASGLQPRTIRSWVAQGLLPGPLSRGPAARYPADQLQRIQAIRTMKELHGMALADIRQELLVASADRIAALADKATTIAPEPTTAASTASVAPPSDPNAAVDYFRALRASAAERTVRELDQVFARSMMARVRSPAAPASLDAPAAAPAKRPASGFEALEQHLMRSTARAPTDRRTRAEERLTIEITPDVELSVRGKLDADQRARLERCAELMRDILTGRE